MQAFRNDGFSFSMKNKDDDDSDDDDDDEEEEGDEGRQGKRKTPLLRLLWL